MKRVFVESELGMDDLLRKEGFTVTHSLERAEAMVVTGLDSNTFGDHRTSTLVPVIVARGKSPDEITRELKERLEL